MGIRCAVPVWMEQEGVARSRRGCVGARRALCSLSVTQAQPGRCWGQTSARTSERASSCGDRGLLSGSFQGKRSEGFGTHHALRDKHVEIQAVLADSGRRGCSDPWLPAAGPADTDGLTARGNSQGDMPRVPFQPSTSVQSPLPTSSAAVRPPNRCMELSTPAPPSPNGLHRSRVMLSH